MANSLPSFFTLAGPLAVLQRAVTDFEAGLATTTTQQQSADKLVTVVANGLGRVVSVTIDPSLVAAGDNVGLASTVMTVANAAIAAAIAPSAAQAVAFGQGLALPTLPAYAAPVPTIPGFGPTVSLVKQTALANNPCSSTTQFPCRSGAVLATVNSARQLSALAFDFPLPEFVPYLQTSAVTAINCAIDQSTNQPPSKDPSTAITGSTVTLDQLVIYANGELEIDQSAEVMGVGCQGFAMIANAGTGGTTIDGGNVGCDVGSILSRSQVTVKNLGRVHGSVTSESTVVLQQNGSVTGPILQNTAVILPLLKVGVQFPPTPLTGINLASNATATAAPAFIRSIVLATGATLNVSSGVYYTDTLDLEANAKLVIDATNGPVIFWVRKSFTFRGAFQDKAGGFPRIWVGYLGAQHIPLEAPYRGSLVAPNAEIDLNTVGAPGHAGSWHGLSVNVLANQTVCFRPFELPFQSIPGARPPDTAPVAIPAQTAAVLGFEDATAWTSTQATLALVTTPKTQGNTALSVSNIHGSTTLVSRAFNTAGLSTATGKLLIDVWVPSHQPNQNWGTLDVKGTTVAGEVQGEDFGPIALTGLPTNAFLTLTLIVPPNTREAIATGVVDLSLSIILNVPSGVGTYYLDNIRFV